MVRFKNDELPQQSLHIDAESLRRIEGSRIRKSVVPIIMAMHQKQARRIALLGWGIEDETRVLAQILALSFAQELDQKCAIVITQGLKYSIDVFPAFALLNIPEIENASTSNEAVEEFQNAQRNFPIQIFSGPDLSKTKSEASFPLRVARDCDAQILILPEIGLSREDADRLAELTERHRLKWLAVLPLHEGGTP